ncbi:MAG: hypothetical protein A3I66_19855 [Burkholderiales bacterium RIFCSPLOWO2_02_FULL_57_36]|nr:MAG: hypothetical protein A3I66_19855 [Burkholderiales bacterium RIFCSPLOWO2_02_FULL_57_36]
MTQAWCCAISGGVRLALQIQPNAKKSGVVGCYADLLKIRLHAQPIEGKANEALISYLADVLDVPKNAVNITRGHTTKRKIVEVRDSHLTVDMVRQVLLGSNVE